MFIEKLSIRGKFVFIEKPGVHENSCLSRNLVYTTHVYTRFLDKHEFCPNTDPADPVSSVHLPLWGSINEFPPNIDLPLDKGGNHAWHSRGVPLLGVRTTFTHVVTPSSCTLCFLIQRIFPEYLPRYHREPSTIYTRHRL